MNVFLVASERPVPSKKNRGHVLLAAFVSVDQWDSILGRLDVSETLTWLSRVGGVKNLPRGYTKCLGRPSRDSR